MIYAASLNMPVKKALGKKVQQSTLNKIIEQLVLDPETSNMDVVFFGPRDLVGPKAQQVQQAVSSKHPGVCVIYLYEKAAESDILEGVYSLQCRKINDKAVTEAFEKFVKDHAIHSGRSQMSSADFDTPPAPELNLGPTATPEPIDDFAPIPNRVGVPTQDLQPVSPEPVAPEPVAPEPIAPLPVEPTEPAKLNSIPLSSATADTLQGIDAALSRSAVPEPSRNEPPMTLEDSIRRLNSVEDLSLFKDQLRKDSIVKKLIEENSEYEGLINMLEVLDKRIQTVWRDNALSAEQKFEKIKAIGLEKSVVRATANSVNVEKVISIISTMALSAKRTIEDKIQSIDAAMFKINADKATIADTSYIDKAIEERMKVQTDLLFVGRQIIDIYKSIDLLVNTTIKDLDEKLPSSSAFINQMVAPLGVQIFTPKNTAVLTNKLLQALQENRIVWSQLEEAVQSLIETLFTLCDKDEEIIMYQQQKIQLLMANRVEDAVIVDSLLKKVLRLYVGASNTGRSATAITWAGVLSRRQNSLLLDLTGNAKFREYGITPMPLKDFLANRPEYQFLCVESDHILGPDEIQHLVAELKSRLNYYPYVNIILDPSDVSGINQLCTDALSINYITNCSTSSIQALESLVSQVKVQNIATKLICIDTPVSPLSIADSIGIDTTNSKIIALPAIPAIKACALKHDRPYEFNDIIAIFEEAFR